MTGLANYTEPPAPAFLFDLDGTLIDSVYQHVIAWRAALSRLDIDLSVWRIHRRIGMSGGLFVSALLRETGRPLSEADIAMLQRAHQEEYLAQADSVRPLPGAPGRWGAACCRVDTAGRNWNASAPAASTPTPPTCSPALTRSGSAASLCPAEGSLLPAVDTPC